MQKAAIWIGAILAAIIVGKYALTGMFTSGEANNAQERVRRVFDGLKAGGDRQRSITLWYNGTFNVPGTEFDRVATEFEAWTRQRNVDMVSAYEISEVKVLSETERLGEAVVRVTGTVNARPFGLRVVQGMPLQWTP
jgi:hypothetical protein